MSFFHSSVVGHFDPRTVIHNLACSREIDSVRVERILNEYPAEVSAHVRLINGYVVCDYITSQGICHEARKFAYHLAKEEGCLVVDNGINVDYPPEAVEAQREALEREQKAWEESKKKPP